VFQLSGSDLFQLLLKTGFDVVDFREIFAPDDAVNHPYYQWVPASWGKRWPSDEIWRARKR
jgi:hypothetical protein